jgi:hypothetical protein
VSATRELPRPLELQQRTHALLLALGQRARDLEVVPMRAGASPIDWLDALRSSLSQELSNVQLDRGRAAPLPWRPALHRLRLELEHMVRRQHVPLPPRRGGDILALPRHSRLDLLPIVRRLRDHHGHQVLCLRTENDAGDFGDLATIDVERLSHASAAVAPACRALLGLERLLGRGLAPLGTETPPLDAGLRAHLRLTALRDFTSMWRVALGVDALIAQALPALVVVGNPHTFEGRTAALVARAQGIPVAATEHGSVVPGDPKWSDCPVDLILAWGEPDRRAFIACGVAPERVVVTGSVRQDGRLARASSPSPTERREILVATSGAGDKVSLDEHLRFIRVLFAAARALPEQRFVVKLHRKDREAHYQQAGTPPNVSIVSVDRARFGEDIYDFLGRARVLVTIQSTSAIDAMAVGVPVIAVDVAGQDRRAGVEFLSFARHATSEAELIAELRAPVASGGDVAARAYVQRHFAHLGRAAEVGAAALEDLLRRGRGRREQCSA